ncbi:hypothetical protein GCM10009740_21520 [Terrabacter terrae]|uniref:Uncharacterized protein n=1 Tax=Terrabacter terrae TaxID=318434 RepID=A0ABP5FRV4_9MICO
MARGVCGVVAVWDRRARQPRIADAAPSCTDGCIEPRVFAAEVDAASGRAPEAAGDPVEAAGTSLLA